ncbi:MAG: InlB B-repeat-containing protein [Chloroflexi bacterium]|nr:InlB B-repeat-containing protein [Chloroflexota bacterium]
MTMQRRDVARRLIGAGVTAALLGAVIAAPVGAAKPTTSGPTISNVVFDGNCGVTMTYSAKGGKLGEVDLYAQTLGYTSPTDTVLGYDIWAGSTSQPATMVNGSATVAFQLAPGGRLKQFTYYGWLYGKAVGTYKPGTLTPYYTFRSTCVMPDFQYTVKFHDGYTEGAAGFIAADQQRVKFGQLIAEPAAPTRNDYVFTGWLAYDYGWLGPNPTVAWDFSTDTMRDYDPLVLVAQWDPVCPSLPCGTGG